MEDKQSDFLDIGGMTCQSCVVRIEKKVGKLEGVEQVTVNLATNIAEVTYAKDKIKLSEIIKNIEKAAKVSGADDFIEKLKNGYDTLLQKEWDNGSELSIGQWQKIFHFSKQ